MTMSNQQVQERTMKRIFYFNCILAVYALTAVSCVKEYEYKPASVTEQGGSAFLENADPTLLLMPEDVQQFTFTVARRDSSKAETITLKCSDAEIFNVPNTISFAESEGRKDVAVTFDVPTGTTHKLVVSIDDKDAFLYAQTELAFTVIRCEEFDGYFESEFSNDEWETPIYKVGENRYMLPDVYEEDAPIYFSIDEKGNVMVEDQYALMYDNEDELLPMWCIGNALDDADLWGGGSGFAGIYDDETGTVTLSIFFYVYDLGGLPTESGESVFKEVLTFLDDDKRPTIDHSSDNEDDDNE